MGFQLWLKCGVGLCVADGKADYSKSQDHDRRKISGLRGAVWGKFMKESRSSVIASQQGRCVWD